MVAIVCGVLKPNEKLTGSDMGTLRRRGLAEVAVLLLVQKDDEAAR